MFFMLEHVFVFFKVFLCFKQKNNVFPFKEVVVFARFWPTMSTFKTRVAAPGFDFEDFIQQNQYI
jgi:hypothetical protein